MVFIIFKIGYIRDMHIVQLLPELNQGGVERGTVELNRELVKRGHHSTVISAGGRLSSVIQDDGGDHITLNLCSKNPFTFFQRSYLLKQELKRINPNILHARSRVPAWLCWQANKSLKLPFITTVHGFNSVNAYSAIMTKGDLVIYGSQSIKDHILKHYEINPEKLRYVPRGVDTDFFHPDQVDWEWINQFKQEHQLTGRTIISVVGRITEWKGQDDFIRAIAEVQKKDPTVIGLIVGGVWHGKEAYLESLKKLAIDCCGDICFAGSQTNVREIYALSNVIVSAASTKPETFGRVTAEALSMNTPVVASAHGGSLDLIENSKNGFLYTPKNLSQMVQSMESCIRLPNSLLRERICTDLSLSSMIKKEIESYAEVLEEK